MPATAPSSVAFCSSAGRVLCHASVSFAVSESGRKVRPAATAFALLRRRNPPVGPVGGVLAALEDAANRARHGVVVLPCDLPRVGAGDVRALIDAAARDDAAVALAAIDGRPQYPVGVWRTEAAPSLAAALAAGRRDFASALASCRVAVVDASDRVGDADEPGDLPGGGLT